MGGFYCRFALQIEQAQFGYIFYIPIRLLIPNKIGGTIRAGSRFIVLIFLISRMESPDEKIRIPPIIEISHISSGVIYGAITPASK